jgi:hypothetical protein
MHGKVHEHNNECNAIEEDCLCVPYHERKPFSLRWTKRIPKKEGWYWVRDKTGYKQIFEIKEHSEKVGAGNTLYYSTVHAQFPCMNINDLKGYAFAGPIQPPK